MAAVATALAGSARSLRIPRLRSHDRIREAATLPLSSEKTQDFEHLCRPHTDKILQMIYRITENWEDAEDALQDCLLSAYTHLRSFDGRSSFATWLTRIGINSALMLIRKRRSPRAVSLDALNELGPVATVVLCPLDQDPERQYLEQERKGALQTAIRSLQPAARQIVEINQLQEHSLQETAERVGMSISATKARLFQAKKALRRSSKLRLFSKRQNLHSADSFSASPTSSQTTESLEAA